MISTQSSTGKKIKDVDLIEAVAIFGVDWLQELMELLVEMCKGQEPNFIKKWLDEGSQYSMSKTVTR